MQKNNHQNKKFNMKIVFHLRKNNAHYRELVNIIDNQP